MKINKTGKGATKCWRGAILSRVVRKTLLKTRRAEQRLKDYETNGASYS